MKTRLLILGALLTLPLIAASKPDQAQITAEQRERFWQTYTEALLADAQAQEAHKRLDAVRQEMAATCGERPIVRDAQGRPQCAPAK